MERTQDRSVLAVSRPLSTQVQTDILFEREQQSIGALRHFPED